MICWELVTPSSMSASSWVIVLPTTSYGELVVASGSASTGAGVLIVAPLVQAARDKPGTAASIAASPKLEIAQSWPVVRLARSGVAASASAFAFTAASWEPASGAGSPAGVSAVSESPTAAKWTSDFDSPAARVRWLMKAYWLPSSRRSPVRR